MALAVLLAGCGQRVIDVGCGTGALTGEKPVMTDGRYGETEELFGDFHILDVASKEEAVENPAGP